MARTQNTNSNQASGRHRISIMDDVELNAMKMDNEHRAHSVYNRPEDNASGLTAVPSAVAAPATCFRGSFNPDSRVRCTAPKRACESTGQTIKNYFFDEGWTDVSVYKSAFVELNGTMSLTYASALIDTTILNVNTPNFPAYVGISNVVLLSLFIYAAAPSSGGHVNPTITFSTHLAGLTEFSRCVLYLTGQLLGGAISGGLIRGSFGRERTLKYQGGGCVLTPGSVTLGQAFIIEMMCTYVLLFLAFGVGLDPRSARSFGPKMGPLLVGLSLGLTSFASSNLVPGYSGASMNPARCWAFAVAEGNFTNQWLWWFGPAAGCALIAIAYRMVPPWHRATAEPTDAKAS